MDPAPPLTPTSAEPAPTLTVPFTRPSHLPLGIIAGAVAAVVGAALWAALTVATERQFAYAAIGVGFLVGFAVRFLGHGSTPVFGIVGGAFALVGCALGNLLSVVGFLSQHSEVPYFEALGGLNVELAMEMMKVTFSPMDLLFYGLAAYCGFKFSLVPNAT